MNDNPAAFLSTATPLVVGLLGKLPAAHDNRTLQFENYVDFAALPPPPAARSWFMHPVANYGWMLNNSLGDCVPAADGHAIQIWTSDATGAMTTVPDSAILQAYSGIGGYVPGNPATDQGCSMLSNLRYFRKAGVGGHKILGFAAVSLGAIRFIKTAINLFGVLQIGLLLPISAQTQAVWDVPPGGLDGNGAINSWGGHCVSVCGYDAAHLYFVSWGQARAMTWAFLGHYCDEQYALLSGDWLKRNGKSVSGFNLAALKADLAQLS